MFKIFRNRMSAAAIIVAFTVAACCSPSEPTGSCQGPPEEAMTQSAASKGTDPMGMSTKTCSLFYLAKNDPVPPLYPGIGSAHWYVPVAQDYFDQGLRFFFAFNSREAYRAFHEAANQADSSNVPCSACHWAQALVLGVDLNEPDQSPYDRKQANAELHRAKDANPSLEDEAMIAALTERYQDCSVKDEKQCQRIRNKGYYDGMDKVLDEFGTDDPNVITLFADAAMNLTSWNYWDKDGQPVAEWADQLKKARTYLEKALNFRQYRRNEGPIHWYIHLMEGSTTPDVARLYADLLAPPKPLAPNASHLVHMPSHIYYRIGETLAAITANKQAIAADDAYFAKEPDLYRPDGDRAKYEYYPHNIHFLLAAAVLSGDDQDQDISRYAEKLWQSLPDKADGLGVDKNRTVYYLARVNFASPEDIRNFVRPDEFKQQPLANIAYDFTQLMADVWGRNDFKKSADKFEADLSEYRKNASDKPNPICDPALDKLPNPKLCLSAILSDLGHARMDVVNAKWDAAVEAAERATKIQDKLNYYELPLWLYPARQTLASVLIRRAKASGVAPDERQLYLADAKRLLLESLDKRPIAGPDASRNGIYRGNGWAYYGLWEIASLAGSQADKDQASRDLNDHWFGDPKFQTLDRM